MLRPPRLGGPEARGPRLRRSRYARVDVRTRSRPARSRAGCGRRRPGGWEWDGTFCGGPIIGRAGPTTEDVRVAGRRGALPLARHGSRALRRRQRVPGRPARLAAQAAAAGLDPRAPRPGGGSAGRRRRRCATSSASSTRRATSASAGPPSTAGSPGTRAAPVPRRRGAGAPARARPRRACSASRWRGPPCSSAGARRRSAASCRRSSPRRSSGARATRSPARAATSPRCAPAPSATATRS